MTEQATSNNMNTRPRSSLTAVMLSLLQVGLGHVYVGRLTTGLIWMLLVTLSAPLVVWGVVARSPDAMMTLLTLPALLIITGATLDAWRLARRSPGDYQLKEYNRWYVYLLLYMVTTGGAVGYAFFVRSEYVEAFKIPTASMSPTLLPGDRLLANKTVYHDQPIRRGDVIVFLSPDPPRRRFVKRVVALAGDTLEIGEGRLILNGQPVASESISTDLLAVPPGVDPQTVRFFTETLDDQSYRVMVAPSSLDVDSSQNDFPPTTVPAHHVFVLGDNRNHARDSRHFGPIPTVGVVGRVQTIYWPAKSWSRRGEIDRTP